ncbi:osmoprotectant transport system permease protein [Williamsia sp. R60]
MFGAVVVGQHNDRTRCGGSTPRRRRCRLLAERPREAGHRLDALWDYITSHQSQLVFDSYQHVSAVMQSVVIATVIGVVIGLLTYRNDIASNLATSISSAVLTVPSFALLGLLIPLVGLGVIPSITALVLYSLLPIIRNTIVGMNNIEPALIDAARGIGMGRLITLVRVELPLVWPAILAGMRLSTQMAMGVLAIAAYVKGPGLGNLIFAGLARVGSPTAVPMALSGTLLIVILALVLDALYVLLGRLTTSKGIR